MKKYIDQGKKDTRSGFGAGLAAVGKKNENVVALCADLVGSLKMDEFIDNNPERFFQMGITEANMMSVAAGMTIGGKIPFTGTFANFSTGRVYDQIRQSIAYSDKNVKICASHAGLTLGEDGATHQVLEDIGMMKMLPGMTVINPCDYNQTKAATKAIVLDAALLVESNLIDICDIVLFVDTKKNRCKIRVQNSRKWPLDEIEKREKFQGLLPQKREVSDVIINNNHSKKDTFNQVKDFWCQFITKK